MSGCLFGAPIRTHKTLTSQVVDRSFVFNPKPRRSHGDLTNEKASKKPFHASNADSGFG